MGWRLGYLLADAGICAEAVKVQDAMIICAPVISQMAAEEAIRADWTYARSFAVDLGARRELMRQALGAIPGVCWSPTRGGLFAFARVEGCEDSSALADDLLEQTHVVTIPGSAFGRSGEGHLRLSYGYATPDDLRLAMERLRGFFEARGAANSSL